MVQTIIQQCPLVGGQSVIRARNMYRKINENLVYDDYNSCLAQGIYRTPQSALNSQDIQQMILKPNPANSQTEIYFTAVVSNNTKIIVLDNTGRVVLSELMNRNNFSFVLHTGQFAPGLYFIEAYNGISLVAKEKLIIIH